MSSFRHPGRRSRCSRSSRSIVAACTAAAVLAGCTVINPPQPVTEHEDLTRFRTWAMAVYTTMMQVESINPWTTMVYLPTPFMPWLDDQSDTILETVGDAVAREASQELGLLTMPGFTVRVLSTEPRVVAVRMRGVPAGELEAALRRGFAPVEEGTAPSAAPWQTPAPGRPIEVMRMPADDRLVAMMPDGDVLYVIIAGAGDSLVDSILDLPAAPAP